MSPEAWAAVSAIAVAFITGAYGTVQLLARRQSATPDHIQERNTAQAARLAGAEDLTGAVINLAKQVAELKTNAEFRDRVMSEIDQRVMQLEKDLADAITGARVLVEWIDSGAAPPSPEVTAELRRLLDENRES